MTNHKSREVFPIVALASITTISGIFLSSSIVSADSSSADASVTVPEACTMTSTVDTAHTANIDPGTYKSDGIGQTTISTTCNDTSGYAIYAIGYTGDEYTGTNHTKLVGANTNTTIATGTTHTGDTSYWSMKLSTGTNAPIIDNSYNDYNVVPDTYTKVAHKTSATGSTASTITTTYAAYISNSQVADSYSGKVKYALVHPNNASAPKIPPAPATSCNTPVPNVTYMQDITSSNRSTVLASLTTGNAYYLRDSRDDEPYCVSKLEDGNLWLLDNLRLDLTDSDVLNNTTASNTNASATSLGYLKNGGGTSSDQYATSGVVEWTDSPTYASSNSYSDPLIGTSNSGTFPWTKDTTATGYGLGSKKIGVFYNLCAASAGSYCYGDGASPGTSYGNVTEDLCPAGWRMPTGSVNGEYQALATAVSGITGDLSGENATNFKTALSIALSGLYYDGSIVYKNEDTFVWSSTRDGNDRAYRLFATSSEVSFNSNYPRSFGLSVRCLLNHQSLLYCVLLI